RPAAARLVGPRQRSRGNVPDAARAGDAGCRPGEAGAGYAARSGATRAARAVGECRTGSRASNGPHRGRPVEGSRACARLVRSMGAVAGVIIVIIIVRMLSGSIKVPPIALAFGVKLAIFVFAIAMVQVTTTDAEVASAALHIVAFVLIWAPTPFLRWVVVPLRMPRTTYWAARICWPLGLTKEIEASAVVYGALALTR